MQQSGAESIEAALKGADVIVVPAGVPRKPGMTRDDLFNINASIVKTIAEASAKVRVVLLVFSHSPMDGWGSVPPADRFPVRWPTSHTPSCPLYTVLPCGCFTAHHS